MEYQAARFADGVVRRRGADGDDKVRYGEVPAQQAVRRVGRVDVLLKVDDGRVAHRLSREIDDVLRDSRQPVVVGRLARVPERRVHRRAAGADPGADAGGQHGWHRRLYKLPGDLLVVFAEQLDGEDVRLGGAGAPLGEVQVVVVDGALRVRLVPFAEPLHFAMTRHHRQAPARGAQVLAARRHQCPTPTPKVRRRGAHQGQARGLREGTGQCWQRHSSAARLPGEPWPGRS